ncbi:uncharacterized protein Z518_05587 [Rhinocladiella mackenziei CBS 650.93]|uniref:EGF-like domain-containing protein n=1 Tax=Rhinocladiella mackenziei CBS 650.93 TaxID=1442369 RepID=A0A0D2FR86_9EURO|nr:uncharacterized protein Z518_05587 [Rhinocladiella mackenziei CBS 650.93]KIX04717.1 hypothetical protein Z518_05587 [Rhinocladiella mackenziei CBS 650.93]
MDPGWPRPPQANHENRFHYPQYKNQQQTADYAQPSQYQQYQQYQAFPPHPSVRVPPNVKLSARQVPAGVGVAPPPVKYNGRERQPKPSGSGMLIQDFKFPAAPPVPASGSGRVKQEPWQSPGRKYNMHESYMSSVLDDFATPRTTPSSRSRGFPTSRRFSGSVYAESEALVPDERFDPDPPSPERSPSSSSDTSPQIVRQASLGKRAKPAMTTIKNRTSQLDQDIPEHRPAPIQTSRSATMTALSAAVAVGMSSQPVEVRSGTPGSQSFTPVRMPFDTSPPASPSADREFLQTPKSPNTIASTKLAAQTPSSRLSLKSMNPLLGLGIEQPAMSDKIPESRRPPRLDMDAVREAENRGSTTSLADLIRRATKLAANLDRGKTASRLGMLDMFGSTDKLGGMNRHSTMSDMISAFPAPAVGGTPTNRRDGAWPLPEKNDVYASTTDLSKDPTKQKRRQCCGLSLPIFIAIIVVVIILVAAAVLIPIFLILVPRQNDDDVNLSNCAASYPCQNGGSSIVSNNTCVCVCSNGFTGSQCETSGNADDCMTATLNDGSNEYKNATIGRSIMPPLSDAQTRFDIPLNTSTILSLFSSNNLSCTSENSLVDFNSSVLDQGTKRKRFVVLPSFEPSENSQPPAIHGKPLPPVVSKRAEPDCELRLERRQDGVTIGTSNGIVFQATSATVGPVSPPSTSVDADVSTITSISGTSTSAANSSGTASPTASSTSSSNDTRSVTDQELEFAKVVVLFVLQESHAISVAINAQQQMEYFFAVQEKGTSSNATVDVGFGDLQLTANFDEFSITKGDDEIIGGKSG